MSRSRSAVIRTPLADAKYRDHLVAKFINILMAKGKKSTAQSVCYGAFDVIQHKTGSDPLKVFHSALWQRQPMVEVKIETGGRGGPSKSRRNPTCQASWPWPFEA